MMAEGGRRRGGAAGPGGGDLVGTCSGPPKLQLAMLRHAFKKMGLVAVLLATASWSHAQQQGSINRTLVEIGKLVLSAGCENTPESTIHQLKEAHPKPI